MENRKKSNSNKIVPFNNFKIDINITGDIKGDLKADDNSVKIMKDVCVTACILGFFGLVGYSVNTIYTSK
ncbi:hypothetical protein WMO40_22370 [Bacillaceae bacterium CLA-AA-H227]|uniref:Uncharacterized protein n=1 Tax=Robertmurraya yapensis (ex Hitch et al 2024) TaxID=3133160 RepID=A0ACC6SHH1_9BACI